MKRKKKAMSHQTTTEKAIEIVNWITWISVISLAGLLLLIIFA